MDDIFRKIIVIGCPGAGKSTFARNLRDLTGLPLFYLDMLWHKADRTTVSKEQFDGSLDRIMSGDEWIIDGNYIRTLETRLEHCDAVFFLDYPLETCLEGARNRVGSVREDMPWVEQELDPEFRQWIEDFPCEQRPRIYELLERYENRRNITIFHSRREADAWLAGKMKAGVQQSENFM